MKSRKRLGGRWPRSISCLCLQTHKRTPIRPPTDCSHVLAPLEALISGAGEGNRTLVISLGNRKPMAGLHLFMLLNWGFGGIAGLGSGLWLLMWDRDPQEAVGEHFLTEFPSCAVPIRK